jgi:hypothetical protein
MQQLPQLTALHSLRHLQLYKTAPLLLVDMQRLAQLTQLTSLLLADQSYMPGAAAMVPVDITPLAGLTQLQSLGIAGVCPRLPAAIPQDLAARISRGEAEEGEWGFENSRELPGLLASAVAPRRSSSSSSGDGSRVDLPPSLTSLTIKRVDSIALRLWSYHLQLLTALRDLRVLQYLEAEGSREFEAFPAPLLSMVAPSLTELTQLAFEISYVDNGRTRRGYHPEAAALPAGHILSCVTQLQVFDLNYCQVAVHSVADWEALGSLTRLTRLYGIHAMCAPPAGWQLPEVQVLGLDTAHCWANAGLAAAMPEHAELLGVQAPAGVWHLNATFPQLIDVTMGLHCGAQWLGVQPVLAELTSLTSLGLDLLFRLDERSAGAFEQLGYKLPGLRDLSVIYSGGPDAWRLPRMHSYTQTEYLSLQLSLPAVTVPPFEHDPLVVSDTVVLAHLLPLRSLTNLALECMPGITPGVVLGLCAAMTQLRQLNVVRCQQVKGDPGDIPSWDGPELQLAFAALHDAAERGGRDACEVFVYPHARNAAWEYQELACEVSDHITAHRQEF